MAMTLAEMRARVRKFVDDVEQARWDTDGLNVDVDGALRVGIAEAFGVVAGSGSGRFRTTGTFTTDANGLVDLSSVQPTRIYAVRLSSGSVPYEAFGDVLPLSAGGYAAKHAQVETLSITYSPGAVFPVGSGASTTWGVAGLDIPELDNLACAIAASHLKADEGEDNPALERRKAELMRAVAALPDLTSWSVSTGHSSRFTRPCMFYVSQSPNALQLVER